MAMNLSAFLAQNAKRIEKVKYAASGRFAVDGAPAEWELGCITAAENTRLRGTCMKQAPVPGKRGQTAMQFDAGQYQMKLCARCVLFPDLTDRELQDSYGVQSAEELVSTMLTPGEFEDLCAKILEINGFKNDEELQEEAKN